MMTWNHFVFDDLERLESRNTDQSKKAVGAVSGESANLGKEEHKHEWTYQYYWNDEYGYLCTASPAPEKRKVRDGTGEDHEVHDGLSDPTETKGKGKGKGPKGGCHACGGDHYVRDCPMRASSGKGEGKGKTSWDWVRRNIGRRMTLDSGRRNGTTQGLREKAKAKVEKGLRSGLHLQCNSSINHFETFQVEIHGRKENVIGTKEDGKIAVRTADYGLGN